MEAIFGARRSTPRRPLAYSDWLNIEERFHESNKSIQPNLTNPALCAKYIVALCFLFVRVLTKVREEIITVFGGAVEFPLFGIVIRIVLELVEVEPTAAV